MAFDKYATSGLVDSSTISTTPGSPTTILTTERQILNLTIDNGSTQALFLSFGENTGNDLTVQPGRAFVIDATILGRKIENIVKCRMAAAATGSVSVNAFM